MAEVSRTRRSNALAAAVVVGGIRQSSLERDAESRAPADVTVSVDAESIRFAAAR